MASWKAMVDTWQLTGIKVVNRGETTISIDVTYLCISPTVINVEDSTPFLRIDAPRTARDYTKVDTVGITGHYNTGFNQGFVFIADEGVTIAKEAKIIIHYENLTQEEYQALEFPVNHVTATPCDCKVRSI